MIIALSLFLKAIDTPRYRGTAVDRSCDTKQLVWIFFDSHVQLSTSHLTFACFLFVCWFGSPYLVILILTKKKKCIVINGSARAWSRG